MSAISEELTCMGWSFTCEHERHTHEYSCASALTHTLMSKYRRCGPIIALKRQWWQDRDSRQFTRLWYFLMSTGKFTERREAVKDSIGGRQAFTYSLHFSCQVLSTHERDHEHFHMQGTRFLESFNKQREAVKVLLAFKVTSFCCQVSILMCTRVSTRMWVWALECERVHSKHSSWTHASAGNWLTLHAWHYFLHLFVKLAVSYTVHG